MELGAPVHCHSCWLCSGTLHHAAQVSVRIQNLILDFIPHRTCKALRSRPVTTSPQPSFSGDFNLAAGRRLFILHYPNWTAVRRLSCCTVGISDSQTAILLHSQKWLQSDGSTRSPNLLGGEDLGGGCSCDIYVLASPFNLHGSSADNPRADAVFVSCLRNNVTVT